VVVMFGGYSAAAIAAETSATTDPGTRTLSSWMPPELTTASRSPFAPRRLTLVIRGHEQTVDDRDDLRVHQPGQFRDDLAGELIARENGLS